MKGGLAREGEGDQEEKAEDQGDPAFQLVVRLFFEFFHGRLSAAFLGPVKSNRRLRQGQEKIVAELRHVWFLVPGSWFLVLGSWFLVVGCCSLFVVRCSFTAAG